MRIIISPAKKMHADVESLSWYDLPAFLGQTKVILEILQGMTPTDLKKLWKCNEQIWKLNVERLQSMDLENRLTPAILAYEGIQYQFMAPAVFTEQEFCYVQEHLRILSGFYGMLKPFDGVTPYRLEMQAKLKIGQFKDLYSYWGSTIADKLSGETDVIVNLASKEYSQSVSKYLPSTVRFITCVFGEKRDGRVIEKGTMCKMARGEMVRYMAENQITDTEQLKDFNRLSYTFAQEYSNNEIFVFLRDTTGGKYD